MITVRLKNQKIKEFAKDEFGSQKALAKAVDVKKGSFYNWTNNYSDFPLYVAKRLANLMGVKLADLLADGEEFPGLDLADRLEELERRVDELENRGFFSKFFSHLGGGD